MKNIYANVERVRVSRQAAQALPAPRVSTSTKFSAAKNYAAACKFFQHPTPRAIHQALAEGDQPYRARRWLLAHAPIDPVSDEEIAQFVASLHADRKRAQKRKHGSVQVVGMTPERALQIAMQALGSAQTEVR